MVNTGSLFYKETIFCLDISFKDTVNEGSRCTASCRNQTFLSHRARHKSLRLACLHIDYLHREIHHAVRLEFPFLSVLQLRQPTVGGRIPSC